MSFAISSLSEIGEDIMDSKLRIEIKRTACESQILREESRRLNRQIRRATAKQKDVSSLVKQRDTFDKFRRETIRNEARAYNIALAYIKGRSYASVERDSRDIRFLEVDRKFSYGGKLRKDFLSMLRMAWTIVYFNDYNKKERDKGTTPTEILDWILESVPEIEKHQRRLIDADAIRRNWGYANDSSENVEESLDNGKRVVV